MQRWWPGTPDRKEKGHITVAKLSSLKTGMMITNARLSYTETRPGTKSSVYFKKNHALQLFFPSAPGRQGNMKSSEETKCRYLIALLSTIPEWKRLPFAWPKP
ncbi:hypothetical protein B5M10_07885 [Pluralibacter gergoviae]|nr:hypothetical protein B5M10_07885 [Pluralibacter gergoviae]PHH46127.1 hypothetical protein CRX51_10350 [Pluralibacter gergoviae]